VLFAAFVFVERKAAEPLIDLSVLGRRPVRAGIVVMLLASALLIGGFFLLSFILQARLEWSPLVTGLACLPVALGALVGAHLGGNLISHPGGRTIAGIAFTVAAAGFGVAALQLDNIAVLVAGIAMAALGLGAAFVASTTTALSHVGHHEAGVVSGLVNTFHEVGGALGVAAVSALAASSLLVPALDGQTVGQTVARKPGSPSVPARHRLNSRTRRPTPLQLCNFR
jgi:predicted MFS family arabinose efflux permease